MKGCVIMYPNINRFPGRINRPGNRFIGGGFLGPFILGGIAGGLLSPGFGPRPYPVPYPVPVPPPYPPYPIYY